MYVNPARSGTDQNVSVIEQRDSIYMITTKGIQYQQELRYGYSRPYAEKYNLQHLVIEQGWLPSRYPCGIFY